MEKIVHLEQSSKDALRQNFVVCQPFKEPRFVDFLREHGRVTQDPKESSCRECIKRVRVKE